LKWVKEEEFNHGVHRVSQSCYSKTPLLPPYSSVVNPFFSLQNVFEGFQKYVKKPQKLSNLLQFDMLLVSQFLYSH